MSNGDNNSQKEDENVNKIFIGGLNWDTTKATMDEYFSKFGVVIDSVVMKDSATGRSRGFGFVTFEDAKGVQNVLNETSHVLDERPIDPKQCNPKNQNKRSQSCKVFVGGLPLESTESELEVFFNNYGPVSDIHIVCHKETNKSRGFGFVTFQTEEAVSNVCQDKYVFIKGKQVECKVAENNRNKGMNMNYNMNNGQNYGAPMNQMNGSTNMQYGNWGNQGAGNFQAAGYQQQAPQATNFQPGSYGYENYQNAYGNQAAYGNVGMQNYANAAQWGNQQVNMGSYPNNTSTYGPAKGAGAATMNQNSNILAQVENAAAMKIKADNAIPNPAAQNEGVVGLMGVQQNQGYHPYRR